MWGQRCCGKNQWASLTPQERENHAREEHPEEGDPEAVRVHGVSLAKFRLRFSNPAHDSLRRRRSAKNQFSRPDEAGMRGPSPGVDQFVDRRLGCGFDRHGVATPGHGRRPSAWLGFLAEVPDPRDRRPAAGYGTFQGLSFTARRQRLRGRRRPLGGPAAAGRRPRRNGRSRADTSTRKPGGDPPRPEPPTIAGPPTGRSGPAHARSADSGGQPDVSGCENREVP